MANFSNNSIIERTLYFLIKNLLYILITDVFDLNPQIVYSETSSLYYKTTSLYMLLIL